MYKKIIFVFLLLLAFGIVNYFALRKAILESEGQKPMTPTNPHVIPEF